MKYKSPQVESETDAADAPKRKLDQRDPDIGTGEGSLEVEKEQPPTKASKSGANAVEEDDEVQEDSGYKDEEFEEEDEEYNEEFDEEEEYDEADDENVDFVKEQGGEEEEDQDAEGDEDDEGEAKERVSSKPKLQKVVKEFGRPPLYGTEIAEGRLESSPDTLLAMVMDAMLKSRPISHDLTQRAVNKLIEVGYHDIRKLGESSWEERTMVLKDGGYNRYREQGATNLGDLAEFVNEKYDGDLNNLLKKAHNDRDETRKLIKEIKGLGDLGVDLFFNNAQAVWPSIAPFIDGRSLETADNVGLGTDLDAIYADLGRDSMSMSRLANGLSAVRLEKRQGDLMAI